MIKRILYSWVIAAVSLAAPVHMAAQAKPAGASAKPAAAAAKPAGGARTVTLEGIDAMKFVPATIEAKRGETLHVVLKATTTMPKVAMAHNFVLLNQGADVTSFVNESMKARLTNYVPDSRKADVIAATGLAGKGETVEVTFTVPKKPGTYTFICTFPGHFAGGMKGTLVVK
jgi:azurin